MSAPKVIVVAGPTATGKTKLGILLAERFSGEIVSADSMQLYRRMDIGTAKATAEERAQVPHHMLDVAGSEENYSVSRYVDEAARCCDDILARGKTPVIVGGTGLYIDSGVPAANPLENYIGGEAMLEELRSLDPERAEKLHPSDKRRIVRAIEIYRLTGETISAHDARTRALPPRYEALRIVLNYRERSELYARIDARVDDMVASGLFEEVEGLLQSGLSPESTAMQAIGYKEAALFLSGAIGREEAVALIKQNSRRYAKRQVTWFSRSPDALFLSWDGTPDFEKALRLSTEFLIARGLS